MYNAILCRYHEIAIKGHNRIRFEQQLMDNLRHQVGPVVEDLKISRVRGRIWLEHRNHQEFPEAELPEIIGRMQRVFGLESFSPICKVEKDFQAIRSAVEHTAPAVFQKKHTAKNGDPVRFRIRARRSDKQFPMRSREIEIALATVIGELFGLDQVKVDLSDAAEVTVGVEVRDEFALVYYETVRGPGGLPTGSNERVLALLSGGIDSPVACYLTMKRGSGVDFVSFHSTPYTPQSTIDKICGIAAYLNQFQFPGKLHLCNIAELQKLIRDKCNARYRTVLYRRMMFRIAAMIARRTGCQALLTGESLGQVASQTVVNMATINDAANMLVLRPLVGMDKIDSIRKAEEIGTYELSKVQVPDSCTVFQPSSPATAVTVERIAEEEALLGDYMTLLEKIVEEREVLRPVPED